MNVIHSARELNSGSRKFCLAIGVFDGVHLGHQQVIRQTVADAEQQEATAVVVTFDCHPNTIVAPDRVPPLIYSLPQKLRAFAKLGAGSTLLFHFDKAFSLQTGEQFIRGLVADLASVRSICVGTNFAFGHKRSGNVAMLKALGRELNFIVHGLAAVSLDGQPVSSTRIRETIRADDLDAASQMLGRAYTLAGEVIHGDQLGRQLGFPTANLEVAGRALPPNGVYAVHAHCQGRSHRALLNIGTRPTLREPTPCVHAEAHLLDFDGELYGEELEITFVKRLRDEQSFPSVCALREQIARDVVVARRYFGGKIQTL